MLQITFLCLINLISYPLTEPFIISRDVVELGDQDWWKHAVFYQIYPRSFKDSDNDGVGDLQGIISKMSHLKDLGIDAAWLSPIYKSPQVDAGYDISDYVDIQEEYGTLEDFDELIDVANSLGIKIVMDFVPNHSSDEHEWFIKSEDGDEEYKDYYVWADGKDEGPPNNWTSVFKNSAWTYSEKREQYYLHQFAPQQPDLNFNNPKVVQEFMEILKFWLDRGVHGFRIDAVRHLFETGFEDEPLSNDPDETHIDHGYLDHIYTCDQPETYDMVYQWRQFVDNYTIEHRGDARIIMTEVYTDVVSTMKYYGDEDRLGAHFSFNFFLITELVSTSNARDISLSIKSWLNYMPIEYTANWVLGNHDQSRIATRMGKGKVDGFNMLLALLPGVAVTYNGEEIGMENGEVSWEEGRDPSACSQDRENFESISRDFERTPFHWDNTTNAGFNEGENPWLPVSSKYLTNNLEQQSLEGVWSHYRVYQTSVALRKDSEVLARGNLEIEPYSDNIIVLKREMKEKNAYILIFNIGSEKETVDLSKIFEIEPELKVIVPSSDSTRSIGDVLKSDELEIIPDEGLVLVETGKETNVGRMHLSSVVLILFAVFILR